MCKRVSSFFLSFLTIWGSAAAGILLLCSQTTPERQADSLLISAVEQQQKGNDAIARNLLERAQALDPDNDAVQYYLGYLAISSDNLPSALNYFEQAHRKDSTNVWYSMRLAQLYMASGRIDAAEKIYSSLQKKRPGDLNVLSSLADIYMQEKKYDEADSTLAKLERIGGNSEYLSISRIELSRQKGDFKTFFSKLNEFFANGDIHPSVKKDIIDRLLNGSDPRFNYFHLNDYDTLLSTCLKIHPQDTSIAHFAGSFFFSARKSDRLQELCALHKDDTRMLLLSAYDFIQRQDYKSALPACDELVRLSSGGNDAGGRSVDRQELLSALTTRGDCYYNLGIRDKAFRDYESALRIDPESAVTLNNYAYYLSVLNKNIGKAFKMSRKAVDADPENATFLDTYGWILYRQKKYAEAKAVFKKVMVYGGKDNPEVLRHYAAVLEALGESALARAYRQQAEMKENGKK